MLDINASEQAHLSLADSFLVLTIQTPMDRGLA